MGVQISQNSMEACNLQCALSIYRNKSSSTKRHSFTSVLGVQLRPNQEHRTNGPTRHSMEISSPELVRSSNPIAANLLGARHQGPVTPPTSSSSATTAVTTSSTPTTHEVTTGGNNRKKPPPLAAVPMVNKQIFQKIMINVLNVEGSELDFWEKNEKYSEISVATEQTYT